MLWTNFSLESVEPVHRFRDYFIIVFTFVCVALTLPSDADGDLVWQYKLGALAWFFLLCLLKGEDANIRAQIVVAIVFATIGEHIASIYLGGYTYRFENVPAYVPPGHGMVYLSSVAMARSGLFLRYAKEITYLVFVSCGLWSLWGVTLAERGDVAGALLYCVFIVFMFKGRSPLLYLGAFFITTWLELIGTAYGVWYWAELDPLFGWPGGNPPSGVAALYCLIDAAAIYGAPHVLRLVDMTKRRFFVQLG